VGADADEEDDDAVEVGVAGAAGSSVAAIAGEVSIGGGPGEGGAEVNAAEGVFEEGCPELVVA
jgi:hypothetical protein